MNTFNKFAVICGKNVSADFPLTENKTLKSFFERKVFRAIAKISKKYRANVVCTSETFESGNFMSVLLRINVKETEFEKCIMLKDGAFYKIPGNIRFKLCADAMAKSERKAGISGKMYNDCGYLAKKYFRRAMLVPTENGTKICYPPRLLSDFAECFVSDIKLW